MDAAAKTKADAMDGGMAKKRCHGEEKVSGLNGTVEMLSARGLALDWAAVFYKTCPARVSFAN
jgi:hypothetical protein